LFEGISSYFLFKLLIFVPVALILKWIIGDLVDKQKTLRGALYFLGIIFIIGLLNITFKWVGFE
jgi:hypothetical protein